jgi:hypothetical protein
LGDDAQQETYVDCSDVHDYLPSASRRSPNLLGSMVQCDSKAKKWWRGEDGAGGRLDNENAFERVYTVS